MDFQIGQKVIIHSSYSLSPEVVDEIERVTKTQIILKDSKSRFRRKDGFLVAGGTWNLTHISVASPEELKKAEKKDRARFLYPKILRAEKGIKGLIDRQDLDALEKIYAVYKEVGLIE